MCTKRQYDKRGARSVVNQRTTGRSKQRRHRPEFLRAYHCDRCGWWHVTSMKEIPA